MEEERNRGTKIYRMKNRQGGKNRKRGIERRKSTEIERKRARKEEEFVFEVKRV